MGGGRRHFLPSSENGSRKDDVNLVEWAKEKGWGYAADKSELEPLLDDGETISLPFLGLFASSHMSFELDRDDNEQPSLLDMAKIAIASLEKASSESDNGTSPPPCQPLGTGLLIDKCRLLYHDRGLPDRSCGPC